MHLDNLVLFKMNKTELARATQVFRTFLKAYSIKGLAYFKRPNDSHKAKTNNQIALWNLFMLKWFVASGEPQHTYQAHKDDSLTQKYTFLERVFKL